MDYVSGHRTGRWRAYAGLLGGSLVFGLGLGRVLVESFPARTWFIPPLLLVLGLTAVTAGMVARFSRPPTPTFPLPLLLAGLYALWPRVDLLAGWTLVTAGLLLTVLPAWEVIATGRAVPWLLAPLTFAVYLRTLGPTVGQADTFEFQVVAPTLGVAHPTGYPLYILLGWLFSRLPVGHVAWRVNLTSATFATATVVLLYRLIRREGEATGWLPPLLAALALAFSRTFWSQAIVAEVYALHNLFVVLLLTGLASLLPSPGREREEAPRPQGWAAPAAAPPGTPDQDEDEGARKRVRLWQGMLLLVGLSFANHLTTALLLPALLLALVLAPPRMRWRDGAVAIGLLALGLSLYLYIPLRWPALHQGVWMSPGQFWAYVTGQQFSGAFQPAAWRTDPTRYAIVGRLLAEPFGRPGLLLALVGWLWLFRRRWPMALATLLLFLAYAWYGLSYYVPDIAVFLLPAHLVLALWIGLALGALAHLLAHRPTLRALLLTGFALLPLSLFWTNGPAVDQSGQRAAYRWGRRVLQLPIPPGAAILADSEKIAPLYYLQRIEGVRPDLDLLVLGNEALYRAELTRRLGEGQPVYLARYLPGLEGSYHLRALGPLTEVGTAPLTDLPPTARPLPWRFGEVIRLRGVEGPAPGPNGGLGITLYWQADAPVGAVYHVRLRLVDRTGQVWWEEEGRHPANNFYPTIAWKPGEIVPDYHELPPDPARPIGSYRLEVGLFPPFSEEGLEVLPGGGVYASLLDLSPEPPPPPPPARPLRAAFGTTRLLLGADVPEVVPAGGPVEVTLTWQQWGGEGRATSVVVTWGREQGAGKRLLRGPEQQEARWTWQIAPHREARWPVGRPWSERLELTAPAEPGRYTLWVGLEDEAGELLPARCGWLRLGPPWTGCAVARLRVEERAASALANFDNRILLLEAQVGATSLRPGEALPVVLRWQGLQTMEEDYTVFVHLLGPDGRLHGQVDAWPVQGTLPTSRWTPGVVVDDPYQVPLMPDAPPGRYQVEVGWYLLATLQRLPVVDREGRATGDRVIVGEFTVP